MNYSSAIKTACSSAANKPVSKPVSNKQVANQPKKYCGVCHKAGKPASDYESHYTRSVPGPSGVITCPIILSAVCKSCGKSGHFSDHCNNTSLQSKQASFNKHSNSKINSKLNSNSTNNLFSALADYDDEKPIAVKNKRNRNIIVNTKEDIQKEIRDLAPNGISFADMLLKTPLKSKPLNVASADKALDRAVESNNISKILFAEKILSQPNRSSWLDSDSESECDCDDYDYDSQSDW